MLNIHVPSLPSFFLQNQCIVYVYIILFFIVGPYTFSIGDTTKFSNYERGGVVTQVKMHKTVHFVSLICVLSIFKVSFVRYPHKENWKHSIN